MQDLTILFITGNKVPEAWAEYHRKVLLDAAGDTPIITLSKKPTPIGVNVVQDEVEFINPDAQHLRVHPVDKKTGKYSGFYSELLKGAKLATTPYIAVAEDDTLYTADHFGFRPPLDEFGYNLNRWSLFTWGPPWYHWYGSKMGCAGIYPRELAVETLEERFSKYPDKIPFEAFGELGCYEKQLGIKIMKTVEFDSSLPIIQIYHDYFSLTEHTPGEVARRRNRRMGWLRALDIPYWGRSENIVAKFK